MGAKQGCILKVVGSVLGTSPDLHRLSYTWKSLRYLCTEADFCNLGIC